MQALRKLAAESADDILFDELPTYNRSGGKPIAGLTNRRNRAKKTFGSKRTPYVMPKTLDGMAADIEASIRMAQDFVPKQEGYRRNAYWDGIGKKWTVGHGLTQIPDPVTGKMRPVRKGDVLEEAKSSELVGEQLRQLASKMHTAYPWSRNLSPWGRAAALDLAYNGGLGMLSAARSPRLTKRMKAISGGAPARPI